MTRLVAPRGAVPVAWKTGTSWGFRDAWAVGLVGHYVLVVWVGNFDGSSNPALVGVQAAGPLFFRLIDALRVAEPTLGDIVLRPPPGVTRVEVCAASGDLPNVYCPQTVSTWFIPGKSPIHVSDVHRRVLIDSRTGLQACLPYDSKFVRSEVFEFWPSDILRLFAEAGMTPRRVPPGVTACSQAGASGTPPHINSPLANTTYTLRAARTASEVFLSTQPRMGMFGRCIGSSTRLTSGPASRTEWSRGRQGVRAPSWSARSTIEAAPTVRSCASRHPDRRRSKRRNPL